MVTVVSSRTQQGNHRRTGNGHPGKTPCTGACLAASSQGVADDVKVRGLMVHPAHCTLNAFHRHLTGGLAGCDHHTVNQSLGKPVQDSGSIGKPTPAPHEAVPSRAVAAAEATRAGALRVPL